MINGGFSVIPRFLELPWIVVHLPFHFPLALVCLWWQFWYSQLFQLWLRQPNTCWVKSYSFAFLVTIKVADIINKRSSFMCENIYNRKNTGLGCNNICQKAYCYMENPYCYIYCVGQSFCKSLYLYDVTIFQSQSTIFPIESSLSHWRMMCISGTSRFPINTILKKRFRNGVHTR